MYDAGSDLEPATQLDRTDHCFERVGEDRGFIAPTCGLLALAQANKLAQPNRARDVGQSARVDHACTQFGQAPLRKLRVGHVERLGDDDTKTESPKNSKRSLVGAAPFS